MNQVSEFFEKLFDGNDWPPRWHCGKWTEFHGWLYIVSDLMIWSAYFAIPLVIIRYVSRKSNMHFTKLYFLFAAFILACGATHFLDAAAFWIPVYRLSALARFITGVISWVTVFYLIKFLPSIFSLRSQAALENEIDERKKAEDALGKLNEELEQKVQDRTAAFRQSEEQYRYLFQNNPMPMWVLDLTDFKFLDVNDMATLQYGYSREEFLAMTAMDIRPEEDKDAFLRSDHSDLSDKLNYNKGIWKHRKKDGTIMQVEIIGHSILFEGISARLILANDVTAQQTVAEKIAKNEKRFRALLENNYDMISLLDDHLKVFYRSPSAVKITGWTDEEISNMGATENIHPDDKATAGGIIKELMANKGKPIPTLFRSLHKRGHYIWLEGTATNLLHDENLKAIVFNFRDVTARIEAEEKLAASELKFRSLIENSSEGITLSDEFSNIHYRSPSSSKIAGGSVKDNIFSCVHPEDDVKIKNKIAEVLVRPGEPLSFEGRFLHPAGHYYWLEGTLTNMLHVKGVNAVVSNYHDITERKELEDLLLKANTLARIGSWEVDLKKETVFWTDITREIHETEQDYTPTLETGLNFYKPGAGRDLIIQKVKEAVETGAPWDEELQIITAKSNERWIRTIGKTEFVNGKCVKIYGSFQDIDERRKAEEEILKLHAELSKSEKRFRGLIENSYDIVSISDPSLKPIYRSPAAERITGWTDAERDKRGGKEDIHPDDLPSYKIIASKLMDHPGISFPISFRIKHKEGHYIFLEGMLTNLLENDAIKGIVGNFRDITENRKAEEKIRDSERIYRTIASSIPGSAILLFDRDLKYLLIEGDMVEKFGYSKQQLLGNTIQNALPPSRYKQLLPNFKRVFSGEVFNTEANLGEYDISTRYVPLRDETGNVYAAMTVVIDISEIKRAERVIAELNVGLEQKIAERTDQLAAANKELEAFSYSVSHDLRAPLRAVNGYASMLEEDYANVLDDDGKRLLRTVQANAKQMGQLIDDLLAFSRLGRKEVRKAEVNMALLTENIVQEIKIIYPHVQLQVDPLHPTWGDTGLIKQVLFNYISNAAKYSSNSETPLVKIKSTIEHEHTVYSVSDNGAGFDMNYAHKLFQVFQRLHSHQEFEGTGVGLAIVERIISKHQGKVWAEGEIGKGATFYFSLPNKKLNV